MYTKFKFRNAVASMLCLDIFVKKVVGGKYWYQGQWDPGSH